MFKSYDLDSRLFQTVLLRAIPVVCLKCILPSPETSLCKLLILLSEAVSLPLGSLSPHPLQVAHRPLRL